MKLRSLEYFRLISLQLTEMYSLDRQKRHIWLLSRIFFGSSARFSSQPVQKNGSSAGFFGSSAEFFFGSSAGFWLLSRIFCFGSSAEFFILAPQPNFFFLLPYQILRLIVLKTPPLNCSYGLKTTMNFNLTVHTALWG